MIRCALPRRHRRGQLAAGPDLVRQMVRANRQAVRAPHAAGNTRIPGDLRPLCPWAPEDLAVRYSRRPLAGPRGESWLAAPSRAAPREVASLAGEPVSAIRRSGYPSRDLDALLTAPGPRRR